MPCRNHDRNMKASLRITGEPGCTANFHLSVGGPGMCFFGEGGSHTMWYERKNEATQSPLGKLWLVAFKGAQPSILH